MPLDRQNDENENDYAARLKTMALEAEQPFPKHGRSLAEIQERLEQLQRELDARRPVHGDDDR
jgi:hypothetical protein